MKGGEQPSKLNICGLVGLDERGNKTVCIKPPHHDGAHDDILLSDLKQGVEVEDERHDVRP